jgi:hypothetical protein
MSARLGMYYEPINLPYPVEVLHDTSLLESTSLPNMSATEALVLRNLDFNDIESAVHPHCRVCSARTELFIGVAGRRQRCQRFLSTLSQ